MFIPMCSVIPVWNISPVDITFDLVQQGMDRDVKCWKQPKHLEVTDY